ncbi:4-hydroxy-tetrahydrodipicolinate synthase [Armatimonadetes bacterium GBS]|jgi:4-hydroxy-tetrahydrodipicolinate synthase|nr:4-hydroxy-tetrahydrodipicolinate synthase [bacterium HR14]CUU02059.1 4-hydroxy-tetrahydrodipicolinate synthase [Armatimonadetes bacterium GBS]CUU35661.1 4-hydroxy-tetrahydrodipicolinate synthase [Armatimonadetes bacterium GXS]
MLPERSVYTAILTPFTEGGTIDEGLFLRLLAFQEAAGVNGVVVAGSTGEGASLSAPEKGRLYELAVQGRGRLQIIAGVLTSSLTEAQFLCQKAQKLGCDALMIAPPFYFPAPLEGLIAYFRAILETTSLPVILYNIPQRTRVPITPELIEALLGYPHLIGIKDSSGDLAQMEQYLRYMPQLRVWVGEEKFLLKCLQGGGAGTISGLANVRPQPLVQIVARFDAGEVCEGTQAQVDAFADAIDAFPAPANFKYALTHYGFPLSPVRPPLTELDPEQRAAIDQLMRTP